MSEKQTSLSCDLILNSFSIIFFFILLILYLPEILVNDILEEKSSFPNLVLLGPSRSYVTGIYLKPQGIMGRIQLE